MPADARVSAWQFLKKRRFANDFVLDAAHWRKNKGLAVEAYFGPEKSYHRFVERHGQSLNAASSEGTVLHLKFEPNWKSPFAAQVGGAVEEGEEEGVGDVDFDFFDEVDAGLEDMARSLRVVT